MLDTKMLVTLLLFCGLFSCLGAGSEDKRPYNERHTFKVDEKKTIVLAEDGKAMADIVLPEHCSKVVDFAAKELKKYLDKATGADFKILRSDSYRRNPEPARTRAALLLGESPWTEALTGVNFPALPRDAFVIKEVNGAIVIAGHDAPYFDPEKELADKSGFMHLYEHATLFGVYDFLERFVGVRFYFATDELTYVPRLKALAVPAMDVEEAPDCPARSSYWQADTPAMRSMQTLRSRNETMHVPNCHGLQGLGLVTRFAESKPDYFAVLKSGKRANYIMSEDAGEYPAQLCYSNKDLEEEIFKDAKSFLSAESATLRGIKSRYKSVRWNEAGSYAYPGYFNIMPSDGMQFCHCGKCEPFLDSDRISDLVFGFTANIARRLKDEGVKGTVTAMAYASYKNPPSFELPDNMRIMVATVPGPWQEQDLVGEEAKAPNQLVQAWHAKTRGNKVSLWNYMIGGFGTVPEAVPPLSPRNIASYYHRNAPLIDGAFAEFEGCPAIHQYLNMYVFDKMLWNTNTDVERLLSEHHQKLFGPAAGPMRKFYDRLEDTWVHKGLPKIVNTALGPTPVKKSNYDLWEKTYTEELLDELAGHLDEAGKLAAADPERLGRVNFVRKNFLDPLKAQRDKYMALKRQIDDLVMEVPMLPDSAPFELDGKLDNPVWAKAAKVSLVPVAPEAPPAKTDVLAFHQDGKLYLGFACAEPRTGDMALKADQRDGEVWADSCVEIMLKPSLERDRANYFHFMVNAKGVVADERIYSGSQSDWKWDGGVQAKADIQAGKGYTVEVAIPLDALLGHPVADGGKLLVNFARARFLNQASPKNPLEQYSSWSPFLRYGPGMGGFHDLENFGALKFVKKPAPANNLLKNGNFEGSSTLDGWGHWWVPGGNAAPRPLIELDKARPIEGGACVKIQNETLLPPGDKDAGVRIALNQSFPAGAFKPDTSYRLTFYVRTANVKPILDRGNIGAFVYLSVADGHHEFFPASGAFTGDMPWNKQGFDFKTPAKLGFDNPALAPHLWLCLWNVTGTVWFDDVRIRSLDSLAKRG